VPQASPQPEGGRRLRTVENENNHRSEDGGGLRMDGRLRMGNRLRIARNEDHASMRDGHKLRMVIDEESHSMRMAGA
jgi:hypothetical protein